MNLKRGENVHNSEGSDQEEKKVAAKKNKKSKRYQTEKSIYLGKKLPKNIRMESSRLRKKYLPKLRKLKKKNNRYEIYVTEIRKSRGQDKPIKKKEKVKCSLLS